METIEHFAQISLVARMLGRENLLSREEVTRLQGLRGTYGITSPAPICTDGSTGVTAGDPADVPGRAGAVGARRAPGAGRAAAGTGRLHAPAVRQAGTGKFG